MILVSRIFERNISLFIIIIIAIAIIPLLAYFFLSSMSEVSIKSALFEQYQERQEQAAKSLAQNIASDLDLVSVRLKALADSSIFQQQLLLLQQHREQNIAISLQKTIIPALLTQEHQQLNQHNLMVDSLEILDKNSTIVASVSPKGEQAFTGQKLVEYQKFFKMVKESQQVVFTQGFQGSDGILRIAILYPIIVMKADSGAIASATGIRANHSNNNLHHGSFKGALLATIPSVQFFQRYGNVYDVNSQFLTVLDSNGTFLATTVKENIGQNFFGAVNQKYIMYNHDIVNTHFRKVMSGTPTTTVFDFGRGERMNSGYPIVIDGGIAYSVYVVTLTSTIYSVIEHALFLQHIQTYLLIASVVAALSLLILFITRWTKTLELQVAKRTEELRKANEVLEKNDKLQREFINTAAHELRTPVQPLLGAAELLEIDLNGKDEVVVSKDHVGLIVRNANRLKNLSSDLLEVARIENQYLTLNKEKVNLDALIQDVIKDCKQLIDNENHHHHRAIKIILESKEENDKSVIEVEADRTRLYQVISNLIRNAIKFTTDDDGIISVSVKTSEEEDGDRSGNNSAIVTIKDTGSGIHPEILPRLFTKFATKSEQGTGLGLYISKSIIDAHGGKIWAENNRDGRGATFGFSLPLK